jgi:RNA polymerase sigma factor (sigma-70 family)
MSVRALKLFFMTASEAADADLLARFVTARDEAAFKELVHRHGPAVLRVCRRLVGASAAEDAFQAVFLVLACRATAVRKAASVGSWLIGVAGRVARQMQKQSRKRLETGFGSLEDVIASSQLSPDCHLAIPELAAVLEEELTQLPDALRAPLVLCLVEGRTQKQAAAELGESLRTVRRRLDRAKAFLRLRLERRGIVPTVAAALVASIQTASAAPPELVRQTVNAVFEFLAGEPGVRTLPAAIVKGVVGNMIALKTSIFMSVTAVVSVGLGLVWAQDEPGKKLPESPPLVQRELKEPPIDAPPAHTAPAILISQPDTIPQRSTNFVVHAPTAKMAREIAVEAEYQRSELAVLWLGKELPPWNEPCEIRYTQNTEDSRGVTTFTFGTRKDGSPTMLTGKTELNGKYLVVLANDLPHQIMHVVMASHFGELLPRWAEQGLAATAESPKMQVESDVRCRELLNAGRGIRLRVLLPMTKFPRDLVILYAQGHSVVRFLISQEVAIKPLGLKNLPQHCKIVEILGTRHQQFIVFLHLGMDGNNVDSWNKAAKEVYGFESVDTLQDAWLDYLKKPESAINSDEKKPGRLPGKHIEPDLIPPTALPRVVRPK